MVEGGMDYALTFSVFIVAASFEELLAGECLVDRCLSGTILGWFDCDGHSARCLETQRLMEI